MKKNEQIHSAQASSTGYRSTILRGQVFATLRTQTETLGNTIGRQVFAGILGLLILPALLLVLAISLPKFASFSDSSQISSQSADSQHAADLARGKTIRAAIHVTPDILAALKFSAEKTDLASTSYAGFEQQLVLSFANSLGMDLELVPYTSVATMFDGLNDGDVDLICSGYGASPIFSSVFKKGPVYRKDQLIAVYKVGSHRPRSALDLLDKRVAAVKNSIASGMLRELQLDMPQLGWGELTSIDYVDLLSRVENDELDVAFIGRSDFQLYRGAFPQLGEAFSVPTELQHRWIFGNGRFQHQLLSQASEFFATEDTQKQISVLSERYYAPSKKIKQFVAHQFDRNVRKRLPKYEKLIKRIADEHQMDWRFLAAISYQESNWLPKARSRTGVRGMMMLTQNTAREMGIQNRLNVEKSLEGGAAYYQKLLQRLSSSITGPDREWMALAAYNFGYGHLLDARAMTAKRGGNPNLWHDVKQVLPLLQQRKHYQDTRYGYARGREALAYVQQIRHYNDVLILKDYVNAHRVSLAHNPENLIEIAALDLVESQQDLAANF